jgi:hypothetical protein
MASSHPCQISRKKVSDVGWWSFFMKYDSYDIYESRKTSKQKIVFTVLEMQDFCVLF